MKIPLPTTRSPTALSVHLPLAASSTSACTRAMEVGVGQNSGPSQEEGWGALCTHTSLVRVGRAPRVSLTPWATQEAALSTWGWSGMWPESPFRRVNVCVSHQRDLSLVLRPWPALQSSQKCDGNRISGALCFLPRLRAGPWDGSSLAKAPYPLGGPVWVPIPGALAGNSSSNLKLQDPKRDYFVFQTRQLRPRDGATCLSSPSKAAELGTKSLCGLALGCLASLNSQQPLAPPESSLF